MDELSTTDLSELVLSHLEKAHSRDIVDAYQASGRIPASIMVKDVEGIFVPFSQNQHLLCLEACGLSNKAATTASEKIYQHLVENEIFELSSARLGGSHMNACSNISARILPGDIWSGWITPTAAAP